MKVNPGLVLPLKIKNKTTIMETQDINKEFTNRDNTWLVISVTPKNWDFFSDSIYSKDIKKSQNLGVMDASRKLSYETDPKK